MDKLELIHGLEAILFASGDPVNVDRIALVLEADTQEVFDAAAALAEELGYKPYIIDGNLRSRHCWVKINGEFYDRYTNVFGVKKYPREYTVLQTVRF